MSNAQRTAYKRSLERTRRNMSMCEPDKLEAPISLAEITEIARRKGIVGPDGQKTYQLAIETGSVLMT
jgi:hypothetical protein